MTRIKIPRWAKPLLATNKRLYGAKGGRGGGKSHVFADMVIMRCMAVPDTNIVCIREKQKSLRFSAKKLIEDKIRVLGVSNLFHITLNEIRMKYGTGIIIFQGMQDHTADSIKSLEGFDIAWIEEAQSISRHSIKLLTPTIRKSGSQIWCSWNPNQPTDAVEHLFSELGDDVVLVEVNYMSNPFLPDELRAEAERCKRIAPLDFDHVWLGGFDSKSESQVFHGRFRQGELDESEHQPMYGMDFGFSCDPTTAVECYVIENVLYIRRDCGRVGLDIDDTAQYIRQHMLKIDDHVIRADSARPETISYLSRHGLPKIKGVKKWPNSVEEGCEFIKTFDEIVIHPSCSETFKEFGLYCYKLHKDTGDILPVIADAFNHYIDAIRYAIEPMIRQKPTAVAW